MSEKPGQYNSNSEQTPTPLRVARFLDGYLGLELLEDIPCPEALAKDYEDMNDEEKNEWYEFTLNHVFREATFHLVAGLGRELKVFELNLVRKRVVEFFSKEGFEYKK